MLTRIDHIELEVSDLDETISFLKKLGFEEVLRTTHHEMAVEMQLPGANQVIYEIHQVAGEENPGINHVAFLVDDIQKTYDELLALGVKFDRGPHLTKVSGRYLVNTRLPGGLRFQLVAAEREEPVEG